MGKRNLLLGFGVLAVAAFIAVFQFNSNQEKTYEPREMDKVVYSYKASADYNYFIRFGDGPVEYDAVYRAQEQVRNTFASRNQYSWEELGPDNLGGRTRALIFDKDNSSIMYAGSVSGGVFKSTNGGQTWRPVTGQPDNMNVVSMCQTDDGTIYVGTGEGVLYPAGSQGEKGGGVLGGGIFRSTDGENFVLDKGVNSPNKWEASFAHINRLAAVGNTVYAATNRGAHYRKADGTWENCFSGLPEINQTAWDVKSSGDRVVLSLQNLIYINDAGAGQDNFVKASGSNGLPNNSGIGRAEIAINSVNPDYIYVANANSNGAMHSVYGTTDGGATWTQIGFGGSTSFQPYSNASSNQGTYNNMLGSYPGNPEQLILGGVQLWERQNGTWIKTGSEFQSPFNPYYVHADKHVVAFHPDFENNSTLFVGTDGGIARSTDGGVTWSSVNRRYNTLQFYTVDFQSTNAGEVVGGAQDNSIQFIDYQGNTPMAAVERFTGDGTYAGVSKFSPDYHIYSSQFANMGRSNDGGVTFSTTESFFAPRMLNAGADFQSPALIWEGIEGTSFVDTSFYVGMTDGLWMTRGVWDFSGLPKWWKLIDIPASTQTYVVSIASSTDGNVVYCGLNTGAFYMVDNVLMARDSVSGSDEGPDALTTVKTLNPGLGDQVVMDIAIDPNDPYNVVLALSRYDRSSNVKACTNTNATSPSWSNKGGTSLPDMPAYTALFELGSPNRVLLGTDMGLWVTENINSPNPTWELQADIPPVPVHMVRQQTRVASGAADGRIYVGTHGRGFWRSSSFVSIEEDENVSSTGLHVYPNPASDYIMIDLEANYSGNAMISVYDMQGKVVVSNSIELSESNVKVDISTLSAGNYIVKIESQAVNKAARIMVQ